MTDPDEPSLLRISDDDRHQVAELLRTAAGEGRLDLDELDERLEATYAARTYADLVPITVDLPQASTPTAIPARVQPAPTVPAVGGGAPSRPERHFAIMSGVERRGVWTVPALMTVTCVMGGAELDLREARFAAREVVLTVNAVMGGAAIIVGPDVDVIVEGIGIMGAFAGPSDKVEAELTADSPVVRVKGVALMGGVQVERKYPRGDLPPGRTWPHRLH